MKVLGCEVIVGENTFSMVHSVEVNTTWEEQVETAKITLPSNIKIDQRKISEVIKVGEKVIIMLGYDTLQEVFSGYVTGVGAKIPIEISCENEMYRLKKKTFSYSGKTTFKELLKNFYSGIKLDAVDLDLGEVEFKNTSQARALQLISEKFGVKCFFRNGILTIGKQYNSNTAKKVKINTTYFIEENLEFRKAEDIKLKVKAISNLDNGKKLEIELGDDDGDARTLNFYNIKEEATLKRVAEQELKKIKYTGYRGDFSTFGIPVIKSGDIVNIIDKKRKDRQGNYYTKGVRYTFGMGGYRQNITLDIKI